jgi:ATP-dependent Clp protease ATP-binding subunit ClpC
MTMLERYVEESRRAIYYAAAVAVHTGTAQINSEQVLTGLAQTPFRSNTLFHLQERVPDLASLLATFGSVSPLVNAHTLDDESKGILAYAAREAGRLQDYWIGTEHLVLGILRQTTCSAARRLNQAGIELALARKTIAENKATRPDYGLAPFLWPLWNKLDQWF